MTEISKDLADLRREYRVRPLRRKDLDPNPFALFNRWFDEATDVEAMDANAMTLATVSGDGHPSARTVLLKFFDESGFVFYTNLGSAKADEIEHNPNVALLFYWHELHRQVKIIGPATRISTAETLKYFVRRPRDSQIGAWVSRQSHHISSRAILEMEFAKMQEKFAAGDVPLPSFWGGYRIAPTAFEFWQGRESRLHDRFVYTSGAEQGWDIQRLAP